MYNVAVRKIIAFLLFFMLVSCQSAEPTVPSEFVHNFKSGVFELNYPNGWSIVPSMQSTTVQNESESVLIPIVTYSFPGSRKGDISSIKELSDAAVSGYEKNGIPVGTKNISGVEAIWIEYRDSKATLVNFYLPLDGSVINCTTMPKNGATEQDMETAKKIVKTFRLTANQEKQ